MRGLQSLLLGATLLGSSLVSAAQTPSLKHVHRKATAIIGARGETTVAKKKHVVPLAKHVKPPPVRTVSRTPLRTAAMKVKTRPRAALNKRAVPQDPLRKAAKKVKATPRAALNKRAIPQDPLYNYKRTRPVKTAGLAKPAVAKKRVTRKTPSSTKMQAKVAAKKRATVMQKAAASPKTKAVAAPAKALVKALPKRKASSSIKAAPAKAKLPAADAKRRSSHKTHLSLYEVHRAKLAKKYAAEHARISSARNVPANLVPDEGQELTIQDNDVFVKEFTIQFKVKFDNFTKNVQMLAATEKHALVIQALGPKFGADATKIGAYMRTESGLGPAGHGVSGSDGNGQLLSQALSPNQWYDVKFQKTPTLLSLFVDGVNASSAVDTHVIIKDTDFDLEAGSATVVAGKMAGSGDIGMYGELGDFEMMEGPLTVPT